MKKIYWLFSCFLFGVVNMLSNKKSMDLVFDVDSKQNLSSTTNHMPSYTFTEEQSNLPVSPNFVKKTEMFTSNYENLPVLS